MRRMLRQVMAITAVAFWAASSGAVFALAQGVTDVPENRSNGATAEAPLRAEQLEQLVAPIALYPDPLLAQVLMASTYPLEVVSAARWSKAHPNVQGRELDAAMRQQPWDPSVKSLTAFPQTLRMMDEKLDWTEKLGDAFLAQQTDTMNAVQRLRAKAHAHGALVSGKEQVVRMENNNDPSLPQIIIIEPAQPDVVYVPVYDPMVVYGPWPYPYAPPYYWYPPGYVLGEDLLFFGAGLFVGDAFWGDFDWHHHHVDIHADRHRRYAHGPAPFGGHWQHDPAHRLGVPYNNRAVESRFQSATFGAAGAAGAVRNQERAAAREFYRGHINENAPRHAQPFGEGRPGEQAPAIRGGEQFHQETGPRFGTGGTVGHWGGEPNNRNVFRNMERGQGAHNDGSRGEESRQIMHSFPEGGGFHGGNEFHGGGNETHGGGGNVFHGGGGGGFHGGGGNIFQGGGGSHRR